MSGSEQHHIPRLLLRGFLSQPSMVWLFRQNKNPKLSSIKKVGVKTHFYSEPQAGVETLDDTITKHENSLALKITAMRKLPFGSAVDPQAAAEAIVHLTMRSAHLRDVFADGMEKLVTTVGDRLGAKEHVRQLLGINESRPNERFLKLVQEEIQKDKRITDMGIPPELLEQFAFVFARENFNRIFTKDVPIFANILARMVDQVESMARAGHNKALDQSITPDIRVKNLSALEWAVIKAPEAAILPDCVALGLEDDGVIHPLTFSDNDRLLTVIMPLSTTHLLIGRRDKAALPDLNELNRISAECSHTFFVGAINAPEVSKLREVIGIRAHAVIDRAMFESISEYFPTTGSQSEKDGSLISENGEESLSSNPEYAPPSSYLIQFQDCADDQEDGDLMGSVVRAVVSVLSDFTPMSRLDGITFAANHAEALRGLDRGFEASGPLTPTEENYGVGVTMSPTVMRDGVIKVHVVIRGDFGKALVSVDEETRRIALHTLVFALSHVGTVGLLEKSLPGFMLSRIEDVYDAERYACVDPAWSGYFSARTSAKCASNRDEAYQEMLVAVLERAEKAILEERSSYWEHRDVPRLFRSTIRHVSAVLRHAALLLGHQDGLQHDPSEAESSLLTALNRMGLRAWFDTYHYDLQLLWDNRDHWKSAEEFFALNQHVDRIFWQFAMFPWRTPDGGCYLAVPSDSDVKRMRETEWGENVPLLAAATRAA